MNRVFYLENVFTTVRTMKIIKNNIANILTVTRLILLPFIVALFYVEADWGGIAMWLCFFIYIVAALTDFFDGYLARKLNQITWFGTFLDPISDKIFVTTLMILLVAFGKISGLAIVLIIIIFMREFLISGLREFLGPKNIKMPVTILAKWKTAAQMLSLPFLIITGYAPYAGQIGVIFLAIATVLTVITGLSYMFAGLSHMKDTSEND